MARQKHGSFLFDVDSKYLGLIGAIIQQAIVEYKKAYKKLSKDLNEYNYGKFITERLFFENKCNGYIDEDLAKYIYEKAKQEAEEQIQKDKVLSTNNYIKSMDEYHKNDSQ